MSKTRRSLAAQFLAGDYCFSQAAGMAAQTENPAIVTIFAQALKTLSEGHLGQLFDSSITTFDETMELLQAGIHATVRLVCVSAQEEQYINVLSQQFAAQYTGQTSATPPQSSQAQVSLSPLRQARWHQLLQH